MYIKAILAKSFGICTIYKFSFHGRLTRIDPTKIGHIKKKMEILKSDKK